MRGASLVFVCMALGACGVLAADLVNMETVAPKLWTQAQGKVVAADPVPWTSNTTAPLFYNWALDIYTSQNQCGTVAEGWSGDFGTCYTGHNTALWCTTIRVDKETGNPAGFHCCKDTGCGNCVWYEITPGVCYVGGYIAANTFTLFL